MKIIADEGIDQQIVDRLRRDGHDVWYVAEMEPGISDRVVFEIAGRESAVILTADKDFGEMVVRQRLTAVGVVLIRLAGLSSARKTDIVVSFITQHASELERSFSVVTPGLARIRRLSQLLLRSQEGIIDN